MRKSIIGQEHHPIRRLLASRMAFPVVTGRATTLIEDIRRAVDDGVQSGKVVLAPTSKSGEDQQNRIAHHPTFEMLETAAIADVVVIDDRYFNQHGLVTGQFGSKPVWTTFDLLTAPKYDAHNNASIAQACAEPVFALCRSRRKN